MPTYTVIKTRNELGRTIQLYKRSYRRIDHARARVDLLLHDLQPQSHYLTPNELASAIHNVQQDCKRIRAGKLRSFGLSFGEYDLFLIKHEKRRQINFLLIR